MKRTLLAKARTVAHHHKHHKPAAAHHHAATGHAHKHHKAAKHHAKPHKHKGTVARGLAAGAEVACCAAEALAASLRLSGLSVSDADMLDLFWRAGGDPDAGTPILAMLEAASEFGLAGVRLVSYHPYAGDAVGRPGFDVLGVDDLDLAAFAVEAGAFPPVQREAVLHRPVRQALDGHALILGVDLPGPHTVLATPDGWWSWGELRCPCEFPDAVIEEAWAVSWQ